MREIPFLRRCTLSLFARDAARLAAAFLVTLGPLSGGIALGATTFQFAYMYGTSGPAAGGSVYLIGNQFQSGATVSFGGIPAGSVTVSNSTRIVATTPAGLTAGGLYDVTVTNPDTSSSTIPKGWLTDFLDVDAANPYHASVETLVREGITAGYGNGNYGVSDSITRAQMAVFLLVAEHGTGYVPPQCTGVFSDVPCPSGYADWIEQLHAEGITGGCGGGKFCPDDPVIRAQMVVFLLVVYHGPGSGYAPPAATGVFLDVPASSPFAPWIEEVARLQVTAGCGGGNFCPSSPLTRGQMAVFMKATFHRLEATRLLEQATWGPTDASVSSLLGQGYLPWLAAQYGYTPSSYPTMTLWPDSVPGTCDTNCQLANYSMYPLQTRFFTNALYQPDQLRQRVSFALHKLVVSSGATITQPSGMAPYLQTLDANAFGNYRDVLYKITLNPSMGHFLNMDTSTKTQPNENYAREIMQLFSIGTTLLNYDGSTQNNPATGDPLPSYDQSVIDNLKLAFTGWYIRSNAPCDPASGGGNTCSDYINPMPVHVNGQGQEDRHDTSAKVMFQGFLPNQNGEGSPTNIPAGQTATQDLNQAIDAIFNHPNVGPYLARELIHSLVTSNPSPAYVERVAWSFNADGTGVRGNLWSVVKAILLDPEARAAPSVPLYGKLKEPVLYINNILRAFNAMGVNRSMRSDGYVNPQSSPMGQSTFKPSTVFSYFPQDYQAPSPPATAGALGPEFGIMDASTSLKRANFVNTMVFSNIPVNCGSPCYAPNGTSIDLAELQALSGDPASLVDRLNRLMMHGTMSVEMKSSIVGAVNAVASSNTLLRAQQALYLVATASQYQVQR